MNQNGGTDSIPNTERPAIEVLPRDAFNQALLQNVRPHDWTNPTPTGRYNLVVVGAGAAGLVSAAGAAGLGAKVALIERHLLGGDCLNVGCVPSKALIRAAHASADLRKAGEFGIHLPSGIQVDFGEVMSRMRKLRAAISPVDSATRFQKLGVDVYFGEATFAGRDSICVGGQVLQFKHAVIATGARASAPPIPGLHEAGYLTNETVFSLTELPRRLAVIGGGPIGCELAQAFARFGSEVTLLEAAPRILPNEDPDSVPILVESLARDRVRVLVGTQIRSVARQADGKIVTLETNGTQTTVVVDEILVGAGRAPNVEGLGLESAGVDFDRSGVMVDDRLRTSNRRIFAAGDICSKYKFTHAADAMARIVIQNALFLGRKKFNAAALPWCTYTDPEIAHVGMYEHDARKQGVSVTPFTHRFAEIDRAILDGQTEGFVKILTKAGSDRILGATIVGAHAGDMISEIAVAMSAGLGLKSIGRAIRPYPTHAECIKRVADSYNRSRLTPRIQSWLAAWLAWTR